MLNKLLFLLNLFFLLVIMGCSDSMIFNMARIDEDPEVSRPRVISFEEENLVRIEWDDDELADGYILYRAHDGVVLNYEEIYRGSLREYVDSDGSDGLIYHYSLAKVRGEKEFDLSPSSLGVFSVTTGDSLEDNDSREKATLLKQGISITANIYGYQDSFDSFLTDEDWYRIEVPADCTANVIVHQLIPLATDGAENYFKSYLEGQPAVPVTDNREINIVNGYSEPRDFYLKLFPNETKFFPNPVPGGKVVSYRIHIDRIY